MRRSSVKNLLAPRLARYGGQAGLRGRTWMLVLALNILMAVVMSIVLVWLNIERMDTTYFINIQRSELREKQGLRAKLEVERKLLIRIISRIQNLSQKPLKTSVYLKFQFQMIYILKILKRLRSNCMKTKKVVKKFI